jgi:lysophospholipase L1-like esterase
MVATLGVPRGVVPALAAVLATALLAGCTSSGQALSPPSPRPDPTPSYGRYVALGDSYTAGPFIPTTDLAGGCLRSDHDYPSLVAARLHAGRLVDVSCSGARTRDLTHAQQPFPGARVPPQLRALTPATDLVTIGIGGNDLDLFGTVVRTCTRLRSQDPTGAPCTRALTRTGLDLSHSGAVIANRVAAAVRAVRSRAPRARVLVVGYLRLVPDHGTCRRLPLATGDYALGRRVSATLDHALHSAAGRTGAEYVDMDAASRGHDVCSADPWVNGAVTDRQRALAYHPLRSGMRAVAREVVRSPRAEAPRFVQPAAGSCSRPTTLPSGSVTEAMSLPPPTSRTPSPSVAPASTRAAIVARRSATCQ